VGVIRGRTLVAGSASGEVLALEEPLSFWGGIDPATGDVIDVHHPQRGANVAGRVLVLPGGRGSSSSSSVLAECVRAGTAPAAIVLLEPDAILALGAIVARELYGTVVPVVVAASPPTAGGARVVADTRTARIEPA
jgi:predicted aconitase with swiveling domain